MPYFHSGVSLLAAPESKSEIPLLAFLLPFSPELWIAIFTSLNITAVAVAVYEWLSPFGLNPWGRQRSKNFSMSSGKHLLEAWMLSDSKSIYLQPSG
jgi:glutamate receptor ionotropic, NMDA 3A